MAEHAFHAVDPVSVDPARDGNGTDHDGAIIPTATISVLLRRLQQIEAKFASLEIQVRGLRQLIIATAVISGVAAVAALAGDVASLIEAARHLGGF